jgi:hypothetical protein
LKASTDENGQASGKRRPTAVAAETLAFAQDIDAGI